MISELSIIIPTLNEEKYLPKLLDSIVAQQFPGKLEVIVVDGGSKDKTIEVARKFSQKLDLTSGQTYKGIGHQRNVGGRKARYSHLLFIDADIIIPKGMLLKYLEKVDPKKRIVGRIIFMPSRPHIFDYLVFVPAYLVLVVHSLISPITSGGFLFTTQDNFRKMNGFIEGGKLGEDLDFGSRSLKDGAKIYTNYSCYVLHSSRRAYKMGRLTMLWQYAKLYIYFRRHGIVPDTEKHYYPYGEYERYY